MGWFSDLFKKVTSESGYESATIEPDKPWPRAEFNENSVILPKGAIYVPPKDISEPVISFVECVRNNPERFRIKSGKVLDKKTNTWFVSNYYYSPYEEEWCKSNFRDLRTSNTSWMTVDEIIYVSTHLEEIQKAKVLSYKSKQRQKYIEIYVESK